LISLVMMVMLVLKIAATQILVVSMITLNVTIMMLAPLIAVIISSDVLIHKLFALTKMNAAFLLVTLRLDVDLIPLAAMIMMLVLLMDVILPPDAHIITLIVTTLILVLMMLAIKILDVTTNLSHVNLEIHALLFTAATTKDVFMKT
jgi:hypothetical protein